MFSGLPPYIKARLESAGPMPPPPLSAWQPTQLKLAKYFMPRAAAAESSATGFFMFGARSTSPGRILVIGTLRSWDGVGAGTLGAGESVKAWPATANSASPIASGKVVGRISSITALLMGWLQPERPLASVWRRR